MVRLYQKQFLVHYLFMFRYITYIFFILFGLCAIISCSLDVHHILNGSDAKFTSFGELWFRLSPNSLQITEVIVSRYIDPCDLFLKLNCSPFLWHPIISWTLALPSTPVFLIMSLIFLFFRKLQKTKIISLF